MCEVFDRPKRFVGIVRASRTRYGSADRNCLSAGGGATQTSSENGWRQNSRVQVSDAEGRFKREWLGARDRGRVFAIVVDDRDAMYVGVRRHDYPATNGVLKLDRDWNIVAAIGFGQPGEPVFNAVHEMAVGRDGSLC